MGNNVWLLHIGLVTLSLLFFLWRGLQMWQARTLKSHFWRRSFPDSIDTALLISGVALAYMWGFSPRNDSWLLVKLMAVLCYIFLGIMALRDSDNLCLKRIYFILALITAAYIISIAHTKLICPTWLC
ncbi:MAG: SirB2 family protein [Mariprofundaceae bacterium]|nr:SirB2 family protein [Mariprofundaceae bacterium]